MKIMKHIVILCLFAATVIASGVTEHEVRKKPSRDENGVFQFETPGVQEELAYALIEILFPEKMEEVETPEDAYKLLTSKDLVPSTPWRTGQVVTVGDLSMLSARLLDAPEEVDRNNPMQCLDYLKKLGVQFKSLGGALKDIEALSNKETGLLKNTNFEQLDAVHPPQSTPYPDP
jgi:hypothetical protein